MTISARQRTIGREVRSSGKGLQCGSDAEIVCKPAPASSGIVFTRTDLPSAPSFKIGETFTEKGSDRRSTIGTGGASVETVEHFLAAMWALGIDNLAAEINGAELPAMDGSALGFIEMLKKAGICQQEELRKVIRVEETLTVEENSASITISPSEVFSVSYLIDYDCRSIGREEFTIELDEKSFEKEIAPARTFCLKKEVQILLKAGLGQGATLENTLVMDENGPVGTSLRFPNEPVRHKILDLVGDLYLLGIPIIGKVTAKRSGHKLNAMLVKKIYEKYIAAK